LPLGLLGIPMDWCARLGVCVQSSAREAHRCSAHSIALQVDNQYTLGAEEKRGLSLFSCPSVDHFWVQMEGA